MKAEFKPIAMRCNQEQFEAIKPKLKRQNFIINVYSLDDYCCYLVNNYNNDDKEIGNVMKEHSRLNKCHTIYETWDEATFLRCCGIEVEETFTVSKEFVLELHNEIVWPSVKAKIEKEFPQLFESKLEVGRWYWWNSQKDKLIFYNAEKKTYGFWNGEFRDNLYFHSPLGVVLATESEVETALIAEAKKIGFKDGVRYKSIFGNITVHKNGTPYLHKDGGFFLNINQSCIFKDGKWATIIEKPIEMTVAEIEAKLGHSVKIVKG